MRQSPVSRDRVYLNEFPLRPETWAKIKQSLKLSPKQTTIVELLLRGMKCKEIAAEIGIQESTLRTYLGRIYLRCNVADQSDLFLHVLALSQTIDQPASRRRLG